MLQAFKTLPSRGGVQRILLLSIAEVGVELTQIEIRQKPTLNKIWVMTRTLLATKRGNVPGHSALSSLTSEQVCVIPAAQLEGEKHLSKAVLS